MSIPVDSLDELLGAAREHVENTFAAVPGARETRLPWRREWKFTLQHSLRVEGYVQRILARELPPLCAGDQLVLRLAALLHDIARPISSENHAALGAEQARAWLVDHAAGLLTPAQIEQAAELIALHSDKAVPGPDFLAGVLKDADTLDEIGAMSIIMTLTWIDQNTPDFFYDLHRRLIEFELPYCEKKLELLNTAAAKAILKEKQTFIEAFIAQLGEELQIES